MTQAFNLSQLANFVNSSGQLDASTGLTNTSSLGFATGTLMLFQQTSAPTGWTKQTTHNDKVLRVVSGTASSGGTSAFTTVFANQTPSISLSGLTAAATTLSTSQMPSHTHTIWVGGNTFGSASGVYIDPGYGYATTSGSGGGNPSTSSAGSGGSHTHTVSGSATSSAITLNVQYVDLIIASKN